MGRKTWDSLPVKPLTGRKNIVLSSQQFEHPYEVDVHSTIFDVLNTVYRLRKPAFCIGGEQIYRMFLPYCKRLYITKIYKTFDADAFFPEFKQSKYILERQSKVFVDPESEIPFQFLVYKRSANPFPVIRKSVSWR